MRAREAMDAKYLLSRNQTLLISDQFWWPLDSPWCDVAFLSADDDAGDQGTLCPADTGAPSGVVPVKTALAQITLLQDDAGAIRHVLLARNDPTDKGYGPVVYKLKTPIK